MMPSLFIPASMTSGSRVNSIRKLVPKKRSNSPITNAMDASGLIPSSTTLDRFNIGSDTKRVNKIYGKELSIQTKVQLGTATTSTLGFFGTTPVARQTVSSTATVATLITALKKYGLIA